ncbi:hypothetical protein V6N13_014555 [Hibiscus sabdariffa]
MINGGRFSSSLFQEIKAFRVQGDRGKSAYDFQISFLERFNNLELLCISNCEIKELLYTEGDTCSNGKNVRTLSTIRKIELSGLHNLKDCLWKQDVQVDHILPNLETLEIHNCENLVSLGSSSASFQNLTTLKVWNCSGMKYLDTCVAVQGLSQLKKLIIGECISVKEIVASEKNKAMCHIIFSRLESLELVNLPRLKSFCSGNHTFGFPCLQEVIVSGCPELGIFCKGVINAPLLQSVEYGRDKGLWDGDVNSTVQHLHSEKVGYQDTWYFVLSEFSKSIEIWKEKSLDFNNIKVLEVEECNSLEFIFSVSMALELVQLTDLKVKKCPMMKYIIKRGAEETTMDTVWLPKLGTIILESCSELTIFCMGNITLQCPFLKSIEVEDCPKMNAMASPREVGGGENTLFFNDKVQFPRLDCLIIVDIGNCRKIWHDNVTMGSFYELTFLRVRNCESLSNILPFGMVERLQKLETLQICECESVEQIIGPEDDHRLNSNELHEATSTVLIEFKSTNIKFVFPKIRKLKFRTLPKLKGFYSKLHTTEWPSLKQLKVRNCSMVETFAREYINFRETQGERQPLISVQQPLFWVTEVSKCHGFRNLVTFTTAKSMVQLKTMSVKDCQMIEEIIASTTDEVTDVIVFNQLESLELDSLPCLSRFCSGNYALVFPMLEEVIIGQCPKMEFFTMGELTTPMLHGLQSTKGKYAGRWEGDLNATIQNLLPKRSKAHIVFQYIANTVIVVVKVAILVYVYYKRQWKEQ